MQYVGVVELQAVKIELDGAPGVSAKRIGEVVGQLLFGQIVDLMIEIRADAANGPGVGLDGLGLQALKFQVLEVRLIIKINFCLLSRICGSRIDAICRNHMILKRKLCI